MDNLKLNGYDIEALRADIQKLSLMDDMLMRKAFDGCNECSQVLLQVILNNATLKVERTKTQHSFNSVDGHSVIMDIYAVDSEGKHYDVEIQKAKKGGSVKRARYYSSMLDSNILHKGEDYEQLGETYIIFITENDVWGENRPLYNIERCLLPECRQVNDGAHILYVNASIQDDTALGRLMHDMFCSDPKKMHYKDLSERVEFLKSAEGGFELMCELSEKLISFGEEKGLADKSREVAVNMLKQGYTMQAIADVLQISVDEVKRIAEEFAEA